jgi:VIT1/CCC1 family predicted Fe2+/Mn2+ transporter
MGLGTLAIALVSLAPIIWGMSLNSKIASVFVMGFVFLGLGFVYTRYQEQLKKLL